MTARTCTAVIHVPPRARKTCPAVIHVEPPPITAAFTVLRNSQNNGLGGLGLPAGYHFSGFTFTTGATVTGSGSILLYTPPIDFVGTQTIQAVLVKPGAADVDLLITLNVIRRNLSVTFDNVFVLKNSTGNILALSHKDVGEGRKIVAASVDIGSVELTPEGVQYDPPVGYLGPPATLTYSTSNEFGD